MRALIVTLCLAALGACARSGGVADSRVGSEPSSTAGCYALIRRDSPDVSVRMEMPDTVMLDTAIDRTPDGDPRPRFPYILRAIARRPGAMADSLRLDSATVVPWPPDWDELYVVSAWRFAAPDSVSALLHQNMAESWHLRFRAAGDSLIGGAEYYDDTEVKFTIPLVARRVACAARGSGTR